MLEGAPPESYQPWAVMDALISLGLSTPADLEVVGADINPRVVDHLRRSAQQPPALTLISGIQENASVTFSPQYREYFAALGSAIGLPGGAAARTNGHLQRSVRVRPEVARALDGQLLDIVTERLDGPPFDIVVATNILPYFDDRELSLAMCNVAAMLAPGGFLLHNEPRPILGDVTEALGLRFEQSRQAAIASVREAPPLADSVWIHRKLR
jgi:chemotaxis methyl-accepting protein methylase